MVEVIGTQILEIALKVNAFFTLRHVMKFGTATAVLQIVLPWIMILIDVIVGEERSPSVFVAVNPKSSNPEALLASVRTARYPGRLEARVLNWFESPSDFDILAIADGTELPENWVERLGSRLPDFLALPCGEVSPVGEGLRGLRTLWLSGGGGAVALWCIGSGTPPVPAPDGAARRLAEPATRLAVLIGFFLQTVALFVLCGVPVHAHAMLWGWRSGHYELTVRALLLVILSAGSAGGAVRLASSWAPRRGVLGFGRVWVAPSKRWIARRFFRMLQDWLPGSGTIVDFGAGHGLLAERVQENLSSASVLAFDYAPWTMGSVRVTPNSTTDIPLDDDYADLVLSVFVLHHCPDPMAILKEFRRICKGRVCIIEDVYENSWDRFRSGLIHEYMDSALGMPYNPAGFASVSGWTRRLTEAGFEVLEFRRRTMFPFPSVAMFLAKSRD